MSAVVALAMALSSVFVFQAQSNAVTQQAIDGGISLSKFVAVQAAIPLLGEDWVTLESFVEDAAARESFRYLIVYDHTGVVRSASDPALVGQDWQQAPGGEALYSMDKVEVTDLGEVFTFTLPVLFNETVVGGVNMGLDTRRMNAALATTQRMLVALGFSVVLAVSVAIYIFNKLMAKKLLLAIRALRLFGQGQLETRISRQSSDEFGELFGAFNTMADAVEKQVDAPSWVDNAGPDGLATPALTEIDVSGITHAAVDEMTMVGTSDDDDAKA